MTDVEKVGALDKQTYVSDSNLALLKKLGLWWPDGEKMSTLTLLKLLPEHIIFGKNRDKFFTLSLSMLYGISYTAQGYTDEELEAEGMYGPNKGVHYICSFNSSMGSSIEDCIVQTMADLLSNGDVCRDREHVLGALKLPV